MTEHNGKNEEDLGNPQRMLLNPLCKDMENAQRLYGQVDDEISNLR